MSEPSMGDRAWHRYVWDEVTWDDKLVLRPSFEPTGEWTHIPDHPQLPSVAERLAKAGPNAAAVVLSRGADPDYDPGEDDWHFVLLAVDEAARRSLPGASERYAGIARSIREQIGEATDGDEVVRLAAAVLRQGPPMDPTP